MTRRLFTFLPAAALGVFALALLFTRPSSGIRNVASPSNPDTARLAKLDLPESGSAAAPGKALSFERAKLWKLVPPPPAKANPASGRVAERTLDDVLRLHGTFIYEDKAQNEAVIRRLPDNRVESKKAGDEIEGYKIVEIQSCEVTLEPRGGGTPVKLRLFKNLEDRRILPTAELSPP